LGRVTRTGETRGVAVDELRRHNLATVVEHLHLNGPSTRSQLTSITGLNRSTVADLIGELVDLRLVTEEPGSASSGPGRPSPVVHARPDGAVVLALEMSVDSIAVATMGVGGYLYDQVRVGRSRGRFGPETTVRDIAELARPLLAELPAGHRLVGVGAAVVGSVRRSDGLVHLAPNLGWRNAPIGRMLTSELSLGVPVLVANDADLGALGEYRRGGLGDVSHLVYVAGEVGIGCGVIADGKPLLGSAGYAGEAGHTMINPEGLICRCGAIGCWETEAGENALLRRMGISAEAGGLGALDEVTRLAAGGDGPTLQAIADTGRWLGIGVANLINLFNPEVIVLGGLYHLLFDHLEASVMKEVERSLTASRTMVDIRRSAIEANAPLVGAAEFALAGVVGDPARVTAT